MSDLFDDEFQQGIFMAHQLWYTYQHICYLKHPVHLAELLIYCIMSSSSNPTVNQIQFQCHDVLWNIKVNLVHLL